MVKGTLLLSNRFCTINFQVLLYNCSTRKAEAGPTLLRLSGIDRNSTVRSGSRLKLKLAAMRSAERLVAGKQPINRPAEIETSYLCARFGTDGRGQPMLRFPVL